MSTFNPLMSLVLVQAMSNRTGDTADRGRALVMAMAIKPPILGLLLGLSLEQNAPASGPANVIVAPVFLGSTVTTDGVNLAWQWNGASSVKFLLQRTLQGLGVAAAPVPVLLTSIEQAGPVYSVTDTDGSVMAGSTYSYVVSATVVGGSPVPSAPFLITMPAAE